MGYLSLQEMVSGDACGVQWLAMAGRAYVTGAGNDGRAYVRGIASLRPITTFTALLPGPVTVDRLFQAAEKQVCNERHGSLLSFLFLAALPVFLLALATTVDPEPAHTADGGRQLRAWGEGEVCFTTVDVLYDFNGCIFFYRLRLSFVAPTHL